MTSKAPSRFNLIKFYSQRILGCTNPYHCLTRKSYLNLNFPCLYLNVFLAETLKIVSTPRLRIVLEANAVTSPQSSVPDSPDHKVRAFSTTPIPLETILDNLILLISFL